MVLHQVGPMGRILALVHLQVVSEWLRTSRRPTHAWRRCPASDHDRSPLAGWSPSRIPLGVHYRQHCGTITFAFPLLSLPLPPVEEEEPMPNYDLGILMSIDIGLALMAILGMMLGFWAMLREMKEISTISERVAGIAERLDARLRRQYADIDRELQDIKGLLGQ